ncbi:hypothetical protein [Dysosmobacter sp.]|uniref:hypothetical protein n=1 Tax=Dysosmobacter sp. TaxID=2591382 RepID=UPI002A8852C1|nr:hypothetical protein [Dysosmobacter sp.]MDY3280879.1 hypothetical protein [Dysosmobacter sp.]
MKIEKRTAGFTEEELEEQNAAGEETEVSQQPEEVPAGRKKPVLTYILILFIVAFLLMAMSFAMHQRSNTEAMTQLQSSVNAIQETQRTQEKIIEVQDALRQKEEELEALEQSTAQEREAQQKQIDAQRRQIDALTNLYSLQQAYSARDFDTCQAILRLMESSGQVTVLSEITAQSGITPPAQRYLQLKEAIEAQAD